ncbi:glycosyltransferase family 2 protein [Neorhizobium alkalisoli]|uniref:GT2 family glycosyltransferase n=1 Tax=Neorhizobium alkalisoli TaxID=528178 RepID=A0A561QCJ1_9HYPH|nr:glycosyltransferase [Neorhizobium alkalisoli]TWF48085.1 GT2 family glycosyltransferase [Neorhizobium alkalisoli]
MASVDVVVPNYNYGRYLRACVESILEQEAVTIRVLIIDNASSDDSAEIARSLSRDPRVELVLRSENLGTHASFNEGIDWAKADYFLLMFSDDFLVPGALKRATDAMEADRSIAFTYGRDVPVKGNAPIPTVAQQPDPPPLRLHRSRDFIKRFCRLGVFQIPGPSIVVRTSVQKRVGHYRTALPHSDDYEVWLRLAMHGPIGELDCIQAGIRSHDANRSTELWAHQIQHILHTAAAVQSFFDHEGGEMKGSGALRRLARRGIANRAYWSGISHLLRRNREAIDLFKLAFRLSPLSALIPPVAYLANRPDTLRRIATFFARRLTLPTRRMR